MAFVGEPGPSRPTIFPADAPRAFHLLAKRTRAVCKKDRFTTTPDGEPGLNYLCAGYKMFFHHVDRDMRFMASRLEQGGAPADIMQLHRQEDARRDELFIKAARNDPCPCKSGKKFKYCHGGTAG